MHVSDVRVHVDCMVYKCMCFPYLQWTTIGPAEGGLEILTLRMKESSPVAWYGTPWSGQPVKWNCLTSRTSLKPRWVNAKDTFRLHFMAMMQMKWIQNNRIYAKMFTKKASLTLSSVNVRTTYSARGSTSTKVTLKSPYTSASSGQYL